tara:strand:+ start:1269 stop:2546 length:1278 start_codon:yes stop_codon:yes gene_type:complete
MLSRRIITLTLLSGILFGQSTMNGYGYGMFSHNDDSSSLGAGSIGLLPTFQNNVSLSNPSTWHNMPFTFLSLSFEGQKNSFNDQSFSNSNLSSAQFIIPAKQKLSIGITFSPFLSRQLTVSDTTYQTFVFSETDTLQYSRSNETSGGSSMAQFAVGYNLNDKDDIAVSIDVLFGSSRSVRNLILNDVDHLLQSRDYFTGSMLGLYYTTKRFSYKDKPLILALNYNFSLNPVDVRNESYQAFIDINSNNYHDSADYPTAGQALMPTDNTFTDEMKITNLKIGLDYEIYDSYHLQFEFDQWNNKGNNNLLSSVYPGYIKGKNRLNVSFSKFSKYLANNSFEKINFRSGVFFGNYDIKSTGLEKLGDVSEIGLAVGFGVRFGLTNNQLDLSYNFIQRDNIYKVGVENIQAFNVGISIGDLWFVKRREI